MKDKFAVLSIFIYVLFLVLINNLTVSYEGVESAGKNMPFNGEENPNYGKAYVLESDDKLKGTEALKKTLEHLDIIKKDLISIFEKNNIKPIDSLNKKLDPNFHQAMMEIEDDTKEPGTIIQEIQKGFTIKDRLLRPSLVGVSKKVTINEEKTEEKQENPENK